MRALTERRHAFSADEMAAWSEALLGSPLVSRSTLAGSFQQTRGFAITFREEGRGTLTSRFPILGRFVDRVLSSQEAGALASRRRPWQRRATLPRTNAYYVNLLVVGEGGCVGRHTDATLRGPSGVPDAVPVRVSALYLSVPPVARGGLLRLYQGERCIAAVRPRTGALVHFRGDLAHEVTPMTSAGEQLRVSLVLEQYAFAQEALARIPTLHVQSKAGFGAYLKTHAEGGPGQALARDLE
jgi:hypothetical protein